MSNYLAGEDRHVFKGRSVLDVARLTRHPVVHHNACSSADMTIDDSPASG